jgi:hypothetical protein
LESWKCSCGIRCADHISTQYRLVQSGKTASGGCSADQGSSEPVAPRINNRHSLNLFRYASFPLRVERKWKPRKLAYVPGAPARCIVTVSLLESGNKYPRIEQSGTALCYLGFGHRFGCKKRMPEGVGCSDWRSLRCAYLLISRVVGLLLPHQPTQNSGFFPVFSNVISAEGCSALIKAKVYVHWTKKGGEGGGIVFEGI